MVKDDNVNPIPMGINNSGTQTHFRSIIDAISQIQQFHVMESSDYEIPEDFLTIRGSLNFFNIGFGSGFKEGLLFTILLTVFMPIVHSEHLVDAIGTSLDLGKPRLVLWILSMSPVIVAVLLCSYLSRYRIGRITKRAVDSLLVGRMFSLIIKAFIVLILMVLFYQYNVQIAHILGQAVAHMNADLGHEIYLSLVNMKTDLEQTTLRIMAIFVGAVLTPFLTIWLVALYRRHQRKKAEQYWED